MNNKGFTNVEIFIVIVVFSAIYLISIVEVSSAFEVDYDQLAQENYYSLIEMQAELYATINEDIFEETSVVYIYLEDLIQNGLITQSEEKENLKIKIVNTNNEYTATIVEV